MDKDLDKTKYVGIAKEIEELLVTLSEHDKMPYEEDRIEKEEYDRPDKLEVNKAQYNKFKAIIYFIHTIADDDNDNIYYHYSGNGLDMEVIWKTPSLYLSDFDQSKELFSKILMLTDGFNVTITGLDEISICFKIKDVMRKVEKD